jgi:serine/threonine protein kinase
MVETWCEMIGAATMGRDDDANVPLAEQVDAVADRFEGAWKAALSAAGDGGRPGPPPAIEDFIGGLDVHQRVALLNELIPLDRTYRARAGVSDGTDDRDYAARFPEWAAAVRPAKTVTARSPRLAPPPPRRPTEVDLVNAALRPPAGGHPRYVVVEKLGEGGMGAVFKAEQRAARPGEIRRHVALKVVPLGMNSRQVLARFGTERQALALMSHPNIATVFDGGILADGRPFFVMELVPGRPITEFADANKLTIEQRLQLFGQVCDAVQHAHAKGVIHRDLKPSNVLAYTDGDAPRAKVIDFGLAKALGGRLADVTVNTELDRAVGTLAYMSPEQVAGDPDIDVRTDVYALGVLLYELLTGVNPFDFKKLAQDEVRRVIREADPPSLSTRLSSLGQERASEISKGRGVAITELRHRLRGELGWIPLKALKKSRSERYETVPALRQDVERYLTARPLKAGPDSAAYRLKKFARRHRGPLLAATAIAVALLLGMIVATAERVGHVRANAERDRAQAISAVLQEILRSVGRRVTPTDVDQMKHRFDASLASGVPEVAAVVRTGLARLYLSLRLYDEAEAQLKTAIEMRARLGDKAPPDLETAAALHEVAAHLRALPTSKARDADEYDAQAASILAVRAGELKLDLGDVPRPLLGPAIQVALRTEALGRTPQDPQLLANRGDYYARLARFELAAKDYRQAIALGPNDHGSLFFAAFLAQQLGDEREYRLRCQGMLDQFKETTDVWVAEGTAKACFIGPLPADLRDRAMDLLARVSANNATRLSPDARAWLEAARGMGQYRQDDYKGAASSLASAMSGLEANPAAHAAGEFFLAMAYHRLSDTTRAKDAWDRGLKLATALPEAGARDLDDFENWILCHAAGREAATVLGKNYPIEKPPPR